MNKVVLYPTLIKDGLGNVFENNLNLPKYNVNLPLELWVFISEFLGAKDWHALIRAVRILGVFSLNINVQSKMKTKFTIYKSYNTGPALTFADLYLPQIFEWRLPNGALHRGNDEYARKTIEDNCTSKSEWFYNGVRHREDGKPAIMVHGGQNREWFYKGLRHRDGDKPAVDNRCQDYDEDKLEKIWYKHGKIYRKGDKPSHIIYKSLVDEGPFVYKPLDEDSPTQYKYQEFWYINEKIDCYHAPTIITYNSLGQMIAKERIDMEYTLTV